MKSPLALCPDSSSPSAFICNSRLPAGHLTCNEGRHKNHPESTVVVQATL